MGHGRFLFCECRLNDHSFATVGLIEIKARSFCKKGERWGPELGSATGRTNRQESLHCLGIFRRNIRPVRTLFHGAFDIGASSGKSGMPEPGGDRPQPATDGGRQSFRIGGHDRQNQTSWKHVQTKAQTGTRTLDVHQARSGSSENRSWLAGLFPADGPATRGLGPIRRRVAWYRKS